MIVPFGIDYQCEGNIYVGNRNIQGSLWNDPWAQGTCHQNWGPEFNRKNPHGGRRKSSTTKLFSEWQTHIHREREEDEGGGAETKCNFFQGKNT